MDKTQSTAPDSSVNRLPPEVLGDVLIFSLDRLPSSIDRYRRAALLQSTCRYWHTVVENTPAFWRDVDPNFPCGLVTKILSFPLSVLLDEWYWSPSNNFKMILAERSRWVTFDIEGPLDKTSLTQLEAPGGVPLLKKFALYTERPEGETSLDLFGGDAPRLTDLELCVCSIKWDSGLFHNLKRLVIQDIVTFVPTKQELVQVLSQNSGLQTLRLSNIQIDATDARGTTGPVVLPYVETLQLYVETITALSILLEMVRTPACRAMKVEAYDEDDEDGGRFWSMLRSRPTPATEWGKRFMPEALHAEVHVGHNGEVLFEVRDIKSTLSQKDAPGVGRAIPPSFFFSLLTPKEPEDVLSFVAEMLRRSTHDSSQLSLTCPTRFFSPNVNDVFLSLNSKFPRTTTLLISQETMGPPFGYDAFGRFLARPIPLTDGSQTWLFPQLRKLSYGRGVLSGEDFADVLRSRHNPFPDDPTPFPVQMDRVILWEIAGVEDWGQELRREVEDVIGEGNLFFSGVIERM